MKADVLAPGSAPPPKSTGPLMTPATIMLPKRSMLTAVPASLPLPPFFWAHEVWPPELEPVVVTVTTLFGADLPAALKARTL
jgi:hypothetical protein